MLTVPLPSGSRLTTEDHTVFQTPTLVVIAALIGAGAVLNGAATQRWAAFAPDPATTDRLHALHVRFLDWEADEVPTDMPMNEKSVATSRRYLSPTTKRSAVVTLISGVPGSVSTHTPDVCYPGSGYRTLHAARKETVPLPGGKPASFYVADFEKKSATQQTRVRVRWAWTTDGTWVAPDSPRWQFARQLVSVPVLYKVYVVTTLPDDAGEERAEDDPVTKAFVAAAWSQYAAAFAP